MTLTHEHVRHLAKRNDSLMSKVEKLKARGAHLTKHGVQILEVSAGAAIGGLVQGVMKDPHVVGGRIPVDLALGIGFTAAAALDLAGKEYSPHLANFGTGFIAAYASEKGFEIGLRKKTTGSFFGAKAAPVMLPPPMPSPAAVAAGDAAATAAALLAAQRQAQGY